MQGGFAAGKQVPFGSVEAEQRRRQPSGALAPRKLTPTQQRAEQNQKDARKRAAVPRVAQPVDLQAQDPVIRVEPSSLTIVRGQQVRLSLPPTTVLADDSGVEWTAYTSLNGEQRTLQSNSDASLLTIEDAPLADTTYAAKFRTLSVRPEARGRAHGSLRARRMQGYHLTVHVRVFDNPVEPSSALRLHLLERKHVTPQVDVLIFQVTNSNGGETLDDVFAQIQLPRDVLLNYVKARHFAEHTRWVYDANSATASIALESLDADETKTFALGVQLDSREPLSMKEISQINDFNRVRVWSESETDAKYAVGLTI